jgi:hypothetical protein
MIGPEEGVVYRYQFVKKDPDICDKAPALAYGRTSPMAANRSQGLS